MRIKLIAITLLMVFLTGCAANSVEDVLRVPALPSEFMEFNDEINKIKASGMEPVAPSSGSNRQSIQLTDLDGDGIDEGIAFFREMSNTYKVYVYIFKKIDDGYEVRAKIEGAGNAVENVTYADLLGNGDNQLIIGWSVSDSDARAVTVYEVRDTEAKKLCEIACLYYMVTDLDSNGVSDLSVVYEDPLDGMQKLAIYAKYEGSILFRSSAPLTQTEEKILRIRTANAADGLPAVFVEKAFHDTGLITDVIIWNAGSLQNITYSRRTQQSDMTARGYAMFCEDIDQDGSLEVPLMQAPVRSPQTFEGEMLRGIIWHGFGEKGDMVPKAFNFRSNSDNWYIMLPLDWEGKVAAMYQQTGGNETAVTFYSYQNGMLEKSLFSVYVFSGENRGKRVEQGGYIKLLERSDAIFAAEIDEGSYLDYDITENMLKERFRYRETEWTTGEVVF